MGADATRKASTYPSRAGLVADVTEFVGEQSGWEGETLVPEEAVLLEDFRQVEALE